MTHILILMSLAGPARADYLLLPDGAEPAPAPAPARRAAPASTKPPTTAAPASTTTPPPTATADATKPSTTPASPKAPACSSKTDEVKDMVAKVMKTNVFNIAWREDHALVGNPGQFIVKDVNGLVRINMINGDGKSVGIAPARFCLKKANGHLELRVGLQRSYLKFGTKFGFIDVDAQVNEMLAKLPNPNELPLIVTPGQDGSKIHIADGMDQKQINSEFTPATH